MKLCELLFKYGYFGCSDVHYSYMYISEEILYVIFHRYRICGVFVVVRSLTVLFADCENTTDQQRAETACRLLSHTLTEVLGLAGGGVPHRPLDVKRMFYVGHMFDIQQLYEGKIALKFCQQLH